jgi:tRNA(His) 5'-end guanylyltransferase
MSVDSLGDRMKTYEAVSRGSLTRRSPVIVRVDGKAFHTWTRGLEKPFDARLVSWMREATEATALAMQGCALSYTQSDEASFLLTDWSREETQPWLGYVTAKVVSLAAAMFSVYFNRAVGLPSHRPNNPAIFDARAFNVPEPDVANYVLWRAKDARRNSIQGLGQAHFSPKQLHEKSLDDILAMLTYKDVIWNWLAPELRHGSFFLPAVGEWVSEVEPRYEDVAALVVRAIDAETAVHGPGVAGPP